MSEDTQARSDTVSQCLDRLEQAWEGSVQTFAQLAAYLEGIHPSRHSELLQHMIDVDLEIRRRRGLDPKPTDYLQVFPNATDVIHRSFRSCAKPPPLIGQYRLERLLGAGGFASVYLACDPLLNRHVAVKLPHAERITRTDALEALRQEAQTAVALDHPGIVRILHVHSDDTIPLAIVMEFVDGPTLQHWMNQQDGDSQPDIREISGLIAVMADSLAYAHQDDRDKSRPGLIHRDVKPGNILLQHVNAPTGTQQNVPHDSSLVRLGSATFRPRLSDFGLAVNEVSQRRQRGVLAGSLPYLSPEQARGETHLLRSFSDVWSLGVIYYELLTRRQPFRGDCPTEILEEIQTRTPRPLQELHPEVPTQLQRICLSCLSKEPANRPTARGLANELRSWLETDERKLAPKPATALPSSQTPSVRHFAGRWPSVAILFIGTALIAVLLGVAGSSNFRPEQPESIISYVERADPDPSDYMPDQETLLLPPNVPPESVHLTIRNLTQHEIEVSMTNCSIYRTATGPEYDPFEQPRNGARFRMRLLPGDVIDRPNLSGAGWYVFFVRRIDGGWHPFRHLSRDIGARSIATFPYILLEISEGNEEGAPYVWNFQESSEPLPDFEPPPDDEV